VDEDVRAAGIGLDEAVTLGAVEPFDSADRHFFTPMVGWRRAEARGASDCIRNCGDLKPRGVAGRHFGAE
jgi:hypothetical protein